MRSEETKINNNTFVKVAEKRPRRDQGREKQNYV